VETFLRLPLYLQYAERSAEAWSEFQDLLRNGFHLMASDPLLSPMVHATIYDKMRLFLQREQQALLALAYGLASHYSWGLGLYLQKRKEELKAHLNSDKERKVIEGLLKKASAQDFEEPLVQVVKPVHANISKFSASDLILRVCEELKMPPNYESG
jgi:hypothetical protein